MKELFELFLAFARIGGLTFGGGYAMLPMLQREAVEKKGWVTEEELMDYYAVGQCIPGVIAVNTAVFIGIFIRLWLLCYKILVFVCVKHYLSPYLRFF